MGAPEPDWITTLQRHSDVPLRWLSEDEGATERAASLDRWAQVPYDDRFRSLCGARLARSTPVALGPGRRRRVSRNSEDLVLFFDPEAPEDPWVSLSRQMPAELWIRGGSTDEALQRRLEPYLVPDPLPLVALPRVLRLYKPIRVDDPALVRRTTEAYEPWFDDASWNNAHLDPWHGVGPDISWDAFKRHTEVAQQTDPDRFPSTSFRSLWSGSVLRMEQLPFGGWIYEVRYTPADDGEVLARLEAHMGITFPVSDLPIDVVASLLRDGHADPILVDRLCAENAEAALAKICLELGEPTSFAILRRWLMDRDTDPELRSQFADLAAQHRFTALLFELAQTLPPDDPVRNDLMSTLAPSAGGST